MNFLTFVTILILSMSLSQFCTADAERKQKEDQWIIQDAGTVASFSYAEPIDFSDSGHVLFSYKNYNKIDLTYGIGSSESGLILLPELPKRAGKSDTQVYWKRVDSSGRVIGIKSMRNASNNGYYPILVTWSPTEGLMQYNFDSSVQSPYSLAGEYDLLNGIMTGQCENSNEIVLTFNGRIFVLKNDKIVDVTSKIESEFKNHGFDFYKLKWSGLAINDNGVIFGLVECYSKHPFKDTPILENKKVFLWSNRELLTFDMNKNNFNNFYLNNNDKASFNICGDKAYIWDMRTNSLEDASFISEEVYKTIYNTTEDSIQFWDLKIRSLIAVLDDGTTVMSLKNGGVLLENEFNYYYFNPSELTSSKIKNNYSDIRINSLDDHFPTVNNKKRICVRGIFINESHPFIIMPK